jgi:hypothetical protein
METALIVLASVHLAGLLAVLFAVAKAPFGHEDEKGFHQRRD